MKKNNSPSLEESNIIDTSTELEKECNLKVKEDRIIEIEKKENKKIDMVHIVFRNQNFDDIKIEINKSIDKYVSDLINKIFEKLKKNLNNYIIRLFFKGRPLKNEEIIENLRNVIKFNFYFL